MKMNTVSMMGPAVRTLLAAAMLSLCAGAATAQERFSLFVPSAQPTVERLVKLARIQDNDVVVDLGSGDGRIVLTAARDNPKIRGWGVDINENLVRQSNEQAKKQGVSEAGIFTNSKNGHYSPLCSLSDKMKCRLYSFYFKEYVSSGYD
jgi:ABC-type amino acid transport substrate-binding protein